MKWHKQGLIYAPDGKLPWAKSHAMLPTPELRGELIRLYFGSCDEHGCSRPGYIDVLAEDPKHIVHLAETPLLDLGRPGSFDDNGVVPASVLTLPNGTIYLYYVGFELGTKVRYRLLTGLAHSVDQGKTFTRVRHTPILERSSKELLFRCGPFVMQDEGRFKLWYIAGSEWLSVNQKALPIYTIHYLESADGLNWGGEGLPCLTLSHEDEHGFGRPYVIKQDGAYHMFYSIRLKSKGYRLGYAESPDGIHWQRKDEEMGLGISSSPSFDSETICYSAVLSYGDNTYLFYNGNDFGRTGIGYATLTAGH